MKLVSNNCNETKDQYILSKEHDEILKKWVMIGHHFFQDDEIAEINIPVEVCPITVKLGDYNQLVIAQIVGNFEKVDEINLSAVIDRNDALRLAGLLIGWASDDKIHAIKEIT